MKICDCPIDSIADITWEKKKKGDDMPLVKLHVADDLSRESGEKLLSDIRSVLIDILSIDSEHGHAILYPAGSSHRACHPSRDGRFVFVEIALFSGRTDEVKAKLFRKVSETVQLGLYP